AWVWDAGAGGVAIAAATSIVVQVGVSASAQAGQILVVRLVPPARRRLVWSVLALLGALAMVTLWLVASGILRQTAALLASLRPWTAALLASPGGIIVRPLASLALIAPRAGLLALLVLALASAMAVLGARLVAAWAGRAGW